MIVIDTQCILNDVDCSCTRKGRLVGIAGRFSPDGRDLSHSLYTLYHIMLGS